MEPDGDACYLRELVVLPGLASRMKAAHPSAPSVIISALRRCGVAALRRCGVAALRRALLVATLEVLRETGYDKLTIDQVVARVHASKATVYRRWSNKAELVCAAFAYSIRAEAPMPDTGTLRGDLLAMAEIIAGDAYQYGRIVAGILGAGERNPQLRELLVEDLHSYVPADLAVFMADSQVPWGVDALGGPVTDPAWRYKPSWYLVTTEDRMIFPAAQRTMSQRAGSTVVEVAASHSVYVSQPAPVTELIKQAVSAVAAQQ